MIGHSNRGRELYAARVGTGDRVMLVTSAIHGNEKTGTEALLHWLQHIGSSNTAETKALLEGITFVAVPMFNPDGGRLNRRQSDFTWDEVTRSTSFPLDTRPAWYYSRSAGGFDVNRDFTPDLSYEPRAQDMPGADALPGFFITPEARTLRKHYLALRDEFGGVDAYVDLHHMGPCEQIEGDGDFVTVTLDYPPLGPEDSTKYDAWPLLDQDKSRRFAYAAYLGMREHAGMAATPTSRRSSAASRATCTRRSAICPGRREARSRSTAPARSCSRSAVSRTTSARRRTGS